METITAVCWGPLAFILAAMIVTNHPLRFPLQAVISVGQMYGNVLYYGICAFDHGVYGIEYSRPENRYFLGYFVFLNAFWIVIPLGKLWLGYYDSRLMSASSSLRQHHSQWKGLYGIV